VKLDNMHRIAGDIIHSVKHQMAYLKIFNSAIKINTEAVVILSEIVKTIMLDPNKWRDENDLAIHW
jgi:hypothetical protein